MNYCIYCNQPAHFQLKNKKWCCSKSYNSCPERIKKAKIRKSSTIIWNKGLTKLTDERVNKISKILKEGYKTGRLKAGHPNSEETRKKISETIMKKVKDKTWHLSFAKSRTYEYKNEKFNGTWEVLYAKWLDKNKIKWIRPKETFEYFYEKSRNYTPDFYLIDLNQYIEIKGYPTKKDFAKWDQFKFDLKILNGRDLFDLGLIKDFRKLDIEYKGKFW